MARGLGWLVAAVVLTGCGLTPSQSSDDPKPTAEPTAEPATSSPTAESTNASPTAEPTTERSAAGPTVGDDLERLLEALPTDNQLHGYRGDGTCRTEDSECDWPYEYGKYLSWTTERGVPLGVSVTPFEGSRDQAIAVIDGPCPDGPFWVSPFESRGSVLGNTYPIRGERTATLLAYGDFEGVACDSNYSYVLPPNLPRQNVREFGGDKESHTAVLSNGFYAVGFSAPDHELLIIMVAEYFERAGLARVG